MSRLIYRPDIDGLRAVAVISVILFHFELLNLSGGYVGVDVFFVISGYLMTMIIWNQLRGKRFSLFEFYENRIRRILPALFVMIIISSLIAFFVLLPYDKANYGESIISFALYLSNVYFWVLSGYFSPSSNTLPLLHTWSLGLEEQFYLLLPLCLILAYRFNGVIPIVLSIFAISLSMSIWSTPETPYAAYYLIHTRVWEFLLGAIIGLNILPKLDSRWLLEPISLMGISLILYSMITFNQATPFPGYHALLPTLGTGLVLYTGMARGITVINTILSNRLLTIVGKISYSLYLWHWPLYVFLGLYSFEYQKTVSGKLAVLLVTFIISAMSWRYVEQPFRRIKASPQVVFLVSAFVTGLIVLLGIFFVYQGPVEENLPVNIDPGFETGHHMETKSDFYQQYLSYEPETFMRSGQCNLLLRHSFSRFDHEICLKPSREKRNALIIGDSHAAHLWFGLNEVFREYHFLQATASRCRPVLEDGERAACQKLRDHIFYKFLSENKVDTIILAGRWYRGESARLAPTIEYLRPMARQIIIIGPVVEYGKSLARLLVDNPDMTEVALDSSWITQHRREAEAEIAKMAQEMGIPYVSLFDLMCPNGGQCKLLADNGAPMQFDYGHFTRSGSVTIAHRIRGSASQF